VLGPARRWLSRGPIVLLMSQWTQLGTQTIAIVVLSHLLDPTAYGVVAMVSAVVGLASVFGEFGLSLSALTGRPTTDDQRTNMFWANVAVGAATMAVVMLCAPVIAAIYHRPALVGITLAIACTFLLNAAAIQFKVAMNLDARWRTLAATESIPGVVGLAGAIGLAVVVHSYWALVAQQIISSATQLLLAVGLSRWLPGRPLRGVPLSEHLRFGRDTAAVQTLNYVASNADTFVVGHTLGASAVGQYTRAYTLGVQPVSQIASPLTRFALPRLNALAGNERYAALVRYQTVLSYCQLGPISFLIGTAHTLVPLILGARWPAVPYLTQIEAGGAACSAVGYVLYWAFLVQRRTGLMVISEGILEVLMVAAMFVVVDHGSAAVAWCVAGGQLAILVSSAIVARAALEIRIAPLARAGLRPVVSLGSAACASLAVGSVLRTQPRLLLLAMEAVVWLAACGVWWGVSKSIREDVQVIARAVRGRS
jgi:polysaccharide transporter, PST family